jgi:hypothetical protein
MSGYFLWLNEEGRELIKKENPSAGVTDIAKSAGVKWGVMDEATKKKYEGMHKKLKEKYEVEYKEWFEDGGEEAIKQAKKDKKEAGGSGGGSGSPKKKKSKKPAGVPTGGSGTNFQSKEFIEDSESAAEASGDGSD